MRTLGLITLISFAAIAQIKLPDGTTDLRENLASTALSVQAGGPSVIRDVRTSDLTATEEEVDLSVMTGLGPFNVTRKYSSSQTWMNVWVAPQMFGVDVYNPGLAQIGKVSWWSSLSAYAIISNSFSKDDPVGVAALSLREPSGDVISVPSVAPVADAGSFGTVYSGTGNSRVIDGTDSTGRRQLTAVRPGIGRTVYTWVKDVTVQVNALKYSYFRLTAFYVDSHTRAPDGGPIDALYTVNYPNATTGVPASVTVFGGATVGINWTSSNVSSLTLGGTPVKVYGYDTNGKLTTVDDAQTGIRTRYLYTVSGGAAGFSVARGSASAPITVSEKTFGGTVMRCSGGSAISGPTAIASEKTQDMVAVYSPQSTPIVCGTPLVSSVAETGPNGNTVTKAVSTTQSNGIVTQLAMTCKTPSNASCLTTSDATSYWQVDNGQFEAAPSDVWSRDFFGNYTDTTPVVASTTLADGTTLAAKEVRSRDAGSIDALGSFSLRQQLMAYQYANLTSTYEQLPEHLAEDSVVSGSSTTKWKFDLSTKFPIAVFRTGATHNIDGGTVTGVVVGTFFFSSNPCSGSSVADPYLRIKEIHGPCFVQSQNSVDCDAVPAGEYYPISQFGYGQYLDLPSYQRSFPRQLGTTGCGTDYLEKTFESYDARGHVTSERSVDNIRTVRNYTGDRLDSEAVVDIATGSQWLTSYSYDSAGHLRAKTLPSGLAELTCYRANADTLCSEQTGTMQSVPTFTARVANGTILEKTVLSYSAPAGALAGGGALTHSDHYRVSSTGSLDLWRQLSFAVDESERMIGSGPTGVQNKSVFDPYGKILGEGDAFNSPQDGCGGISKGAGYWTAASDRCTRYYYDRVNRPSAILTPNGFLSSFEYDSQGHLSKTSRSISSATLPPPQIDVVSYENDDFGNVTAIRGWWMAAGQARRSTFDARGNEIQRKLPGSSVVLTFTYDGLNRPLSAMAGGVKLWSYGYDNSMPAGISGSSAVNCLDSVAAKTLGRVRWKDDSFGRTWYEYSGRGQVLAKRRVRAGSLVCSASGQSSSDATPDSQYQYDSAGRLTAVKYPHGRWVTYEYDLAEPDRVKTVKTSTTGPSTDLSIVVQNIKYGLDGSIRSYDLGTSSAVNVSMPHAGNSLSSPACSDTAPTSKYDSSGRFSGVWITRAGSTIFQRQYVWNANQLGSESTCVLDDVTPSTVSYSYDKDLQVTGATRPTGQFASLGGQLASRTYSYVADGTGALWNKRTAGSDDDTSWNYGFDGNGRLSTVSATATTWLKRAYSYDPTGAVNTLNDTPLTNGNNGKSMNFSIDDAFDSVFKSIVINGGSYSYLYDVEGRRRLKTNPFGFSDEYFYEEHNLIEDRGLTHASANDALVLSEYIWLAGMPVAVVKTALSSSYARLASADCTRNDELDTCGTYFIVNDYLPKPIAMLDAAGKIVGTGDYDVFGKVNEVAQRKDVPANGGLYSPNQNSIALASLVQPWRGTQKRVQMRVNFAQVNTASTDDRVWVETSAGLAAPGYTDTPLIVFSADGYPLPIVQTFYSGQRFAVASNWFDVPNDSTATVRWTSSAAQATSNFTGATLKGYEYRRFESGGSSTNWLPLRFPGQYADSESGLFENWHRFLDPNVGAYLSPDPLTLSPGHRSSTYGYADNDPVTLSDEDGRQVAIPHYEMDSGRLITGDPVIDCDGLQGDADACAKIIVGVTQDLVAGAAVDIGLKIFATVMTGAPLVMEGIARVGITGEGGANAATVEAPASTSESAAAQGVSKEAMKGIRSLEKQIAKHEAKLAEFKANPTVRPGMEGQPMEKIKAQHEARINHLETEIRTFRENIKKLLGVK